MSVPKAYQLPKSETRKLLEGTDENSPLESKKIVDFFAFLAIFECLAQSYIFFSNCRESAAYVTMLFAWTLTEMVRYTFYALSVIDIKLALVTWLRYTLFIVLYPLGAGSELVTMYSAMPDIKKSSILTLAMPNQFNATFRYCH